MRLIVLAVLSLMAGCAPSGGATDMPAAPPELRFAQANRAAVLYAGGPNANDVDVYPAGQINPPPQRHISAGLDAPTGMAVDGTGNLYVCNNAGQSAHAQGKSVFWTVTVYKRGRGRPFRTYTSGVVSPVDVAIGGDGTVYVANYSSGVTVYPPGTVQYSKTLKAPSGDVPIGVAVDTKGHVFASYVPQLGSGGVIYKYAAGRTRGKDLGIAFTASPHGVAVDSSGNLIVAVSNAPSSGSEIEIFAPGKTKPKKILTGPFQPFMVALSHNERRLYVADYGSGNNDGAVFVYKYPSGTLLFKDTNGAAAGAYGVALSP